MLTILFLLLLLLVLPWRLAKKLWSIPFCSLWKRSTARKLVVTVYGKVVKSNPER